MRRLSHIYFAALTAGIVLLSAAELGAQLRPTGQLPGAGRGTNDGRSGFGQQQRPTGGQLPGQSPAGRNPLRPGQATEEEEGDVPFFGEGTEIDPNADTVKKRRPRMPLESYHFSMEERARRNMRWTVDPYTNHLDIGHIDSIQNDFQNDYPFMKRGVGSAYLGNLGAPAQPLSWFDRDRGRNHIFSEPWGAYLRTVETMPFYNTKRPFTQLGYEWAGQKIYQEEDLVVIHAQNITPQTGFNLDYRSLGTKGIYQWQATRDKRFSMGVSHTGKRWTVHAGYIHNQVKNQENGGVTADTLVTIRLNEYDRMRTLPMRMSSPVNSIRSNTFFLHQTYGIPLIRTSENDFTIGDRPAFFIGHSIEYDRWAKRYEDTYAGTKYDDPTQQTQTMYYYDKSWFNGAMSRDSLFESRLSNRVFVQLQPWDRAGAVGTIDVGVGVDLLRYFSFSAGNFLTGVENAAVKQTHTYVYGRADGHVNKFIDWRANLRLHPLGDRAGDTEAGGEVTARLFIKERPLSLSGRIRFSTQEPGYWDENYSSNHFIWSNSFDKETETLIEGSVAIPHVGLSATVSQSVLGSKVYYGEAFVPVQAPEPVSVTGVYLREDLPIRLGASSQVNLNHRVMLQWSSDQKVVPVPLASVYLSYSFEFNVVKDVLRLQVGVDGRYNTLYYAPGYNPGTGRFYNQREKELGDYVWLDAFVNAKWKRMRIFVKMQHLSDDMFGSRNFFSVLHYPMNRRILKLGISWNFYD